MGAMLFGLVGLVFILWTLNGYVKADPKMLARLLRPAGGILALLAAGFVGFRGHFEVAVPLGAFGLGLLGWGPFASSGLFRSTQKSPGQVSRVRSAFIE